jgi:hypothetical protein
MSSNLPPGVTDSMIPGNRPEDAEEEAFWETLYADLTIERVDAIEADEFLKRIIVKARDLGYNHGYALGQTDQALLDYAEQAAEQES